MDFSSLFTSTVGRINRAKWWIGIVILIVASIILNLVLVMALGLIGSLITQLILFYPTYALHAKRFQDRGRGGILGIISPALSLLYSLLIALSVLNPLEAGGLYYLMLVLMLGVGIWYLVDLGCLKGSTGQNSYGADPLGAAA